MLGRGFRVQIPSTEVERLIKIGTGADKRTVQKYMRMLTEDLAFLKTVATNQFGTVVYRIDVETIEAFMSEHLKEKLKQLRLNEIRLNSIEEEVKTRKA